MQKSIFNQWTDDVSKAFKETAEELGVKESSNLLNGFFDFPKDLINLNDELNNKIKIFKTLAESYKLDFIKFGESTDSEEVLKRNLDISKGLYIKNLNSLTSD